LGKDSLHGAAIQSLEADIERGRFESGQGRVSEHAIIPDYLAYIKKAFAHVRANRLHVVVDCGNGMGGLVGPDVLRTLGCRVTGLYEEADGRFPNHQPDPTVLANLQHLIHTMRERGADVGLADRYFWYDDASYASCRLIEILAKAGRPLSALRTDLPHTVSTPEIRVDCRDDVKFQVVEEAKKQLARDHKIIVIDGVRVLFPDGWGLIRASNTQPALVLRFEATSEPALKRIREIVESQVKQYVTGGSGGH